MTQDVPPMTCQEFVELVTDYVEGVLDEDTRMRFEHHIGLCPGCDTYLRQMEDTAARLGSIPAETLSDEAQSTLLDAFRDFPR